MKFFEKNYFNVILTAKKYVYIYVTYIHIYLGFLFRLLIGFFYSQERNFLQIFLHVSYLSYSDVTPFISSKIILEANQGGQRTGIRALHLFLAFQVKDFCQWNLYSKYTGRGLPWSVNVATFLKGHLQVNLSVDLVTLPQQI